MLLRLLACSRDGLTRNELLSILRIMGYTENTRVTVLDWAIFKSAAQNNLYERPGGLINFSNQYFKEAVEYTLFGLYTITYDY